MVIGWEEMELFEQTSAKWLSAAGTGLLCLVLAAAGHAGQGCLADPDPGAAESSGQDAARGLSIFMLATGDRAGVVRRLSCSEGSLNRAAVQMEPGQRAKIELLVANPADVPVFIGHALSLDSLTSVDWIQIEQLHIAIEPGGYALMSLVIDVPANLQPGQRHEQKFELIGDDGSELPLNITLEIIEEQPMFRDGFEIDPVLGQFSQRQEDTSNGRQPLAASIGSFAGPE